MKDSRVDLARRKGLIGFAGLATTTLLTPRWSVAQADTGAYPSKPIELVIPFAPGGGVDLFGRTVARVLNDEKIVPQSIQIINEPGAGGAIGMADMVQRRKGDPYSLLGISIHVHLTPLTMGTQYSYKDMTPIAKLFTEYNLMVVRTESPIESLKEVEASLKKDPGQLKFGGATVGNSDQITLSKFATVIGVDPTKLTYIGYSGGESNAAILGGHVDVGFGGLDLIDLVEAGKMRVLAISAPKRLGGRFKDQPTFTEQGYNVLNDTWRGIFGPPGISADEVKYWQDAFTKLDQSAGWKAELDKNQWVDSFETTTFLATLDKEHEVYKTLLGQLGLVK
jgi:putative tricarboxylic transport membrane protein